MRDFLDKMFKNKIIAILLPIIISLILYVLFIIFGSGEEKKELIIITPIVSIFLFFGVFLVIYVQIKNPMCPEWFLNFFEIIASFFFSVGGHCYCNF